MRILTARRLLYLLLAAAGFYLCSLLIPGLAAQRVDRRLTARETLAGAPPAYILADSLLGGFRSFLISALWMRAQNMKQQGEFFEMVDIYKMISTMEPNYPASWANMAWDLSYNVAAEFDEDPHERLYWVFRGVSMLRDEAIRHNPRSALLYYELSWIFYNKATNSVDPAFPLYRQFLAMQVGRILLGTGDSQSLREIIATAAQYPDAGAFYAREEVRRLTQELRAHGYDIANDAIRIAALNPPELEKILAPKANMELLRTAMLLEMNRRLRTDLNMSPELMLELNTRFTDIDWRLPQAHALYWSWLGNRHQLEEDPQYTNLRFERMIYFSLIQLAHMGGGIVTEDGMVIAPPNPQALDKVIEYMEDLLERKKDVPGMDGVRSAFENFLRVAVFNFYFEDDRLNAERVRQRLVKFSGYPDKYGGTLTQFIQKELPDFVDGMTPDRSMMLLVSFCNRAYWYLANGDLTKYQERMLWFEANYLKLYQNWLTTFQGTYNWRQQYGMPSPDELRAQLAVQIISGEAGYPEDKRKTFEAGLPKMLPEVWKIIENARTAQPPAGAGAPQQR